MLLHWCVKQNDRDVQLKLHLIVSCTRSRNQRTVLRGYIVSCQHVIYNSKLKTVFCISTSAQYTSLHTITHRRGDPGRAGRSGDRSRLRRDFSHLSRAAPRPTQPPVQWVPSLSRGLRWPEHGVDHPPLSRAEVHEKE